MSFVLHRQLLNDVQSTHSHEIETRDTRIAQLDSTVKALTTEKAELFDQLQMRQAELESSQSSLESLQSQYVESQYQMREANDRIALLNEELTDARRDQVSRSQDRGPSTEEVTRLLSAAEAKYESRIADLRRQLTAVERERDDGEALFSKKLAEKAKEVEQLRGAISASTKDHQEEKGVVTALREEIKALKEQAGAYQQVIDELRLEAGKVTEVQGAAQTQLADANARIAALQQQAEEHKAREAQVRAHNKVCIIIALTGRRLIYFLRLCVRSSGRCSPLLHFLSVSATLALATGPQNRTAPQKRARRRLPRLTLLKLAHLDRRHRHCRMKRSTSSTCAT